jgi:hypothetical protein
LKIQEYFGFGRVYFSGKTAQFKVFRLVDLLSIVSNFNSYPVGGLNYIIIIFGLKLLI